MVGVAQLVEHLVVVQDVAGSSPVTHPTAWQLVTLSSAGVTSCVFPVSQRGQAAALFQKTRK